MKLVYLLLLACIVVLESTALSCPLATGRTIIISDYPASIPATNCVGWCYYYPNSKLDNLPSLNLGMSDTLIVIAGPTSSPYTAKTLMQSYKSYIQYYAGITNLLFYTYPVPSPDANGATAASNTLLTTQMPGISASVQVKAYAAYIVDNPTGSPCSFYNIAPTPPPCPLAAGRTIIVSDYPSSIPTRNCPESCYYYPNSMLDNLPSLNLGMSDTLIVIAGPTSSPYTAKTLMLAYKSYIQYYAGITHLYFYTYPVPSTDANGATAASNTLLTTQMPGISAYVQVRAYATYIADNPTGSPCAYWNL